VVEARLVAQIVLELFFGWKLQRGEPLEDMVDRGLRTMLFTEYFTFTFDWLMGGRLCLGHLFPPFLFSRKSRLDNDPQPF
jgi:hypothetical protein